MQKTYFPDKYAKTLLIVCMAVAIIAGLFLFSPYGAAQEAATYVGSGDCEMCHEDLRTKIKDSAHEAIFDKDMFPEEDKHGCEACHGPGSNHVQGQSEDNNALKKDIHNPAKTVAALTTEKCIKCHEIQPAKWQNKGHFTDKTGCVSCHKIHIKDPKKDFMIPQDSKFCATCHQKHITAFNKSKHSKEMTKSIECFDCHNPHVPLEEQKITACVKCHTDKKGPFLYPHGALEKKGCGVCHNPHILEIKKEDLPVKDLIPNLCTNCHKTPHFPKGCIMCHQKPHGSNVDEFLLR